MLGSLALCCTSVNQFSLYGVICFQNLAKLKDLTEIEECLHCLTCDQHDLLQGAGVGGGAGGIVRSGASSKSWDCTKPSFHHKVTLYGIRTPPPICCATILSLPARLLER